MADEDFFNRNLYRAYPFVEGSCFSFNKSAIVDMQVVFVANEFDAGNVDHKIVLTEYYKDVSYEGHKYSFKIEAPTLDIDEETITIVISNPVAYQIVPFTWTFGGENLAYGFITIGNPDTVTTTRPPSPFTACLEPANIQNIYKHAVTKIIIANQARVVASRVCEDSSSEDSSSESGNSYTHITAPDGEFVGDVQFKAGYNCNVTVLATANSIRFSAIEGGGDGFACEEIPRTDAEVLLALEAEPLDGAERCNEVISSINGIPPNSEGNFGLYAGRGVAILTDTPNTLTITARDSIEDCHV